VRGRIFREPPQNFIDAFGLKRLGKVVIESCRQGERLVAILPPAREGHECDRVTAFALPDHASHFISIEAGHADVQQCHMGCEVAMAPGPSYRHAQLMALEGL
jgi:hypothetical protein